MIPGYLRIILDGTTDTEPVAQSGYVDRVVLLDDGRHTESRAPAVEVVIRLADGSLIGGMTTLKLFLAAADAMRARTSD